MAEISQTDGTSHPAHPARDARGLALLRAEPLHLALLAGVLLLAALLRFWGLCFGLPYFEHPDEWAVAEDALRMLRTGDFSPFSYTYPTLYVYLQVGVAWLHFLLGAATGSYRTPLEIDPAHYYVWARALTAGMGVGLVLVTYQIGRRIADRTAGLVAALLLAILPTAVGDSHYVTVDTPSAFFAALAFLAIVRWVLTPQPALPKWESGLGGEGAGLLVGMAASTKYNTGILAVALLAALLMRLVAAWRIGQRSPLLAIRLALGAGLGVLAGFTLGTPLWLPELARMLDDLASIARHYRETGHPGAESLRPWLFYWGALHFEAPLVAWAALAGAILAIVRRARADLLLLAVVLPYMLQLSSVRVVFFRNFVPLMPFVCLLAAIAIVWVAGRASGLLQRLPARYPGERWAIVPLIAITALVAAFPLAKSARDEWLRAQPTTRIQATEWVLAHAPVGSRIWLEDQTLILPASLRVEGGRPVTTNPPSWYPEQGFRFLVVNASTAQNDAALLDAFHAPAARFEAAGQRYGHTFLVYDTGLGNLASEPRTRSGATLAGGALQLEGYRHAGSVAPGEVLRLALYWQAARAVGEDYTVFVHLVDAQGAKLAQRDLPPLNGSRPTSSWLPGELIRDDQDLAIPAMTPPGRYTLLVGMYDSATLASINDAGPIAIGEVVVGP